MTKWILILVSVLSLSAVAAPAEKAPVRKPSNFFDALQMLGDFATQVRKAKSCAVRISRNVDEGEDVMILGSSQKFYTIVSCDGVTTNFPTDIQNSAGQNFSFLDMQSALISWFGKERFHMTGSSAVQAKRANYIYLYFVK